MTSQNAQTLRAAWIGMEATGRWARVPTRPRVTADRAGHGAGTPSGLFRHYWVLISLALTVLCTVVLLHMPTVSATAAMLREMDMVREMDGAAHSRMGGDLFHPGVGLVVLLAITVLNVYKPRGLTHYGWQAAAGARTHGV